MEAVGLFFFDDFPEGLNDRVAPIFYESADADGKRGQPRRKFDDLDLIFQAAFFQNQQGHDAEPATHADHGDDRLVAGDLRVNIGANPFIGKPLFSAAAA